MTKEELKAYKSMEGHPYTSATSSTGQYDYVHVCSRSAMDFMCIGVSNYMVLGVLWE